MVYRLVPPASVPSHPLQCSDVCVETSRRALEELVQLGEAMMKGDMTRWNMVLNL